MLRYVLRSASELLAVHRIKRVLFEITHRFWELYGVASLSEGYAELRSIFVGWDCIWACNGKPFPWAALGRRTGGRLHRVSGCESPWNEIDSGGVGHLLRCARGGALLERVARTLSADWSDDRLASRSARERESWEKCR